MQYAINTDTPNPIMLLNKHIGMDDEEGMGIESDVWARELLYLDSLKPDSITVWINSPGGSVMQGFEIANAILQTKTKVDTYCIGMAASMAAVIFQMGRNRVMADYSFLLYHNPYSATGEPSPFIDAMRDSINTMICEKSGMTPEACKVMMDRESIIMAEEALQMRLCDTVNGTVDFNKPRLKPVTGSKAFYKEVSSIVNSHFSNQNKSEMKKVTDILNLQEGANEGSIVGSITSIQNSLRDSQAQNASLTAQLAAVKDSLTAITEERDTLQGQVDTLEAANTAAEEATKLEAAKTVMNGYVKLGKIKGEAEVINKWAAMWVKDEAGTKELIESLPAIKNAAKIVVKDLPGAAGNPDVVNNVHDSKKVPTNAVAMMGRVMAKVNAKKAGN